MKNLREGGRRFQIVPRYYDTNVILSNGNVSQLTTSRDAGTLSNNAASSGKVAKRTSALHFPAADGAVSDGLRLVRTSKWQI